MNLCFLTWTEHVLIFVGVSRTILVLGNLVEANKLSA